ncbi:MAG: bifunctional folylpolyglutamate synthase/dihydrofolate synthase [Ruminococcaceae bacterium]|nr:bifunctional folylpolyglutamate synthase/dihydrofolate synthase [Oscillospiraceae bacterium]
MDYTKALEYIHSIDWRGSRPGLSRVSELLEKLGNPQDSLKFIHVGGTNGKGSFCSMLSSVLTASGLKTGLFTSPYIESFNERMMINGQEISNDELAELTYKVSIIADKMDDPPTEFELISALAMLYFKQNNCDIVVLEVGLGGRLDATNVIKNSVISVITGIALDHTAILGDTVEEIALEKAGIIKQGRGVLLGCATAPEHKEAVKKVISDTALSNSSEIFFTDPSAVKIHSQSLDGTEFDYKSYKNVRIPLLGSYQIFNAANVLEAVDLLNHIGYSISEKAIKTGLLQSKWKARFEKICDDPTVFFDGSHNPQGVSETVKSIKKYFGDKKVIVVTGVLADKDYMTMSKMISSVAKHVYTITPDNPRALPSDALSDIYRDLSVDSQACNSIKNAVSTALKHARECGLPVFVLGSLYTYSDVKKAVASAKSDVL